MARTPNAKNTPTPAPVYAPPATPVYVPPAVDSDAPLDLIEQAIVRALVQAIVREIRAEQATGTIAPPRDATQARRMDPDGIKWKTVADAAQAWAGGVHVKTLYAAIRAGKLKAARIGDSGRKMLLCEAYVNEWLQASARERNP